MSLQIPGSLLGVLILGTAAYAQSVRDRNRESSAPVTPDPGGSAKAPDLRRVEQLIVAGTNEFRKQEGRERLRLNPKLTKAAQEFAAFMASKDKLSHTADDREPSERTAAQGYEDCIVAENIAYEFNSEGFTTSGLAQALVEGWKKSPEHRKNMLDADLDEIGVGVAFSKDTQRYYAVQDFGRPKSEQIVFKITNESTSAVDYTLDGKPFTIEPRYTVTHERCRPPELTFRRSDEKSKGEILHPQNGARYLIRNNTAGGFSVTAQ
jgi:uncharacterized protein YkwD